MAGIELVYFIVMIAVFVIFLVGLKVPAGISLMLSAIVGGLVAGFGIPLRHLVEGTFGFIDPIMTIIAAMIFMVTLEKSGAMDASSVFIVEKLHKYPTLLLIAFMFIIMFPAMITGSAVASIISSGALVAPIMMKIGIPRNKTSAIIALGAVLGMIAPPINIPVMLICDVVDMPYIGFTLPLLILTIPLAIFSVLLLGRKHIKTIDLEDLQAEMNFKIKEEVNGLVFLPILILVVLIVLQNTLPRYMIQLGLPLTFIIAAISTIFFGKKFNIIFAGKEGDKKSLGAAGIDRAHEENRAQAFATRAQNDEITVIVIHVGGAERRGDDSDIIINKVAPKAQLMLVADAGNHDGFFTNIAKNNGIEIALYSRVSNMKAAFEKLAGK